MKKYSKNVGAKFNEDGSVKKFPGNSIISHIYKNQEIYKHLVHIRSILEKSSISEKYTLLPVNSYHMTVKDLICDEVREIEHWSSKMPIDVRLDETDRYFKQVWSDIKNLDTIRMKFGLIFVKGVGVSVTLIPATKEQKEKLKAFRDQIAIATGVRHPNHEIYRFHVSLAYLIEVLDEEDEKELKVLEESINKYLKTVDEVFELNAPELVLFDDMFSFPLVRL